MDNKVLAGLVGLSLVLCIGIGGFYVSSAIKTVAEVANNAIVHNAGGVGPLGTTLTYTAADSKIETYNLLDGITQDLRNVASSTGNGLRGTATWNPGSMSTTTPLTTTTISVTGASLGDLVWAGFDSATSTERWSITGKVSSANTVMVTMELADTAGSDTTAALDISTSTLYVKVAQQEDYAFQTATTTAANR